MTKKASKRAAPAAAETAEEAAIRTVKYVVNRPYSAGEHLDIVDAEVAHEYEDETDLLRLKLINPPADVEEDQKRVRFSDRHELGTWFEAPAEGAATQEATDGAGA
jgi:hypothetical protein